MFRLIKNKWFWIAALPFFALIIVFIINPFIKDAEYCPLPTFFETSHGSFLSPINYWYVYLILFIFAEIVFAYLWLLVSGIFYWLISSRNPDYGSKGKRRVFLSMPIVSVIISAALWMSTFAVVRAVDLPYRYLDIFTIILAILTFILIIGTFVWMLVIGILQLKNPEKHHLGKGTIISAVVILILIPLLILPGIFAVSLNTFSLNSARSKSYSGLPSLPSLPGTAVLDTIGFSVGGAKDADNFRENIANCYLPAPTDITYEGLFYDYKFDTRNLTRCDNLFCPQYEPAIIPDPFNKQDEYFLSVGLSSNILEKDYERLPLNMVVVLDISGSMSSAFNKYYYDKFSSPGGKEQDKSDWDKTKMEIAKEAISDLTDHLNKNDRFGMVIYDDRAEILMPIKLVEERDADSIKKTIANLSPQGGTNMEAGLRLGTQVLEGLSDSQMEDYENRIIFLTDAQPNTGSLDKHELYQIANDNAKEHLHTTFIGIGVDFNTELIEGITNNLRGANYFAVHSSSDFEKRLDEEFEFAVNPLVFDLELSITGGDYEIREVYGSPEASLATGEVLKVRTLFPSPTEDGESRGGVIVAHLKQVRNTNAPTKVTVSYTDRTDKKVEQSAEVIWDSASKTPSQNARKAVLLARFANLMQNWMLDENHRLGPPEKTIYIPINNPIIFYESGMPIPRERYGEAYEPGYVQRELSYWERLSRGLIVSKDYKDVFKDFINYFEEESRAINDDTLKQEVKILKNLTKTPNSSILD